MIVASLPLEAEMFAAPQKTFWADEPRIRLIIVVM